MTPTATARPRNRVEIDDGHKWNLDDIYTDWETWERARVELEQRIGEYAALKGTLGQGPDRLLAAYQLNDQLGQLAYKVYFYPSLKYDEDQRDNRVNARRQQVQALMARWQQATSWFSPELLTIPLETVKQVARQPTPSSASIASRSKRSSASRSTSSTSRASG